MENSEFKSDAIKLFKVLCNNAELDYQREYSVKTQIDRDIWGINDKENRTQLKISNYETPKIYLWQYGKNAKVFNISLQEYQELEALYIGNYKIDEKYIKEHFGEEITEKQLIQKAKSFNVNEMFPSTNLINDHLKLKKLYKVVTYFLAGLMIGICLLAVFTTNVCIDNRSLRYDTTCANHAIEKYQKLQDSLYNRLHFYEIWRAVNPEQWQDFINQTRSDRLNRKKHGFGIIGKKEMQEIVREIN